MAGKLFDTIAPRFSTRAGGYTRVLRLGRRQSDSAEIAQIELVGSEYDPKADEQEKTTEQRADDAVKGVGGRLRAASKRLRTGKKSQEKKDTAEADT